MPSSIAEYLERYNGYHILRYENTNWVRIFHHNSTKFAFFSKDNSTLAKQMYFINETDRFSVLGSLNEHFYINNTFNFLMIQPDDYKDMLFFFNQSSNPYTTTEVTNFSKNFDPRCIEKYVPNIEFLGLALSNFSKTFIDGNPQATDWNYAFGANSPDGSNINTFPGVRCKNYSSAHALQLWIRFDQFSIFHFLPYKKLCSICICRSHIPSNIAVFIVMFLEQS